MVINKFLFVCYNYSTTCTTRVCTGKWQVDSNINVQYHIPNRLTIHDSPRSNKQLKQTKNRLGPIHPDMGQLPSKVISKRDNCITFYCGCPPCLASDNECPSRLSSVNTGRHVHRLRGSGGARQDSLCTQRDRRLVLEAAGRLTLHAWVPTLSTFVDGVAMEIRSSVTVAMNQPLGCQIQGDVGWAKHANATLYMIFFQPAQRIIFCIV